MRASRAGCPPLRVLQWNVHSARSRRDEIIRFCAAHLVSVFALSETWLIQSDRFSVPGYGIVRSDSLNRNSQGLAFLVHHSLSFSVISLGQLEYPCQAIRIRINSFDISIINFYLPCHNNKRYTSFFLSVLSQIQTPCILVGDFNGHHPAWGSPAADFAGESIYENLLIRRNFCLLNDGQPTHLSNGNGNLTHLDLSFCSPSLFLKASWAVLNCGTSDHFPVLSCFGDVADASPTLRRYRAFKRADWVLFGQTISSFLSEYEINCFKGKDKIKIFEKCLFNGISSSTPLISVSPKASAQPSWWTKETRKAVIAHHAARNRFCKTRLPADLLLFRIAFSRCRSLCSKAKRAWWMEIASRIDTNTPPSWVWRMAKFSGPRHFSIPALTREDGSIAFSDKERADALMDLFVARSSISARQRDILEAIPAATVSICGAANGAFTLTELEFAISRLKSGAPGPDNIPNVCLKHLPLPAKLLLLDLFNDSFRSGSIPPAWKKARIFPLLKQGKSPFSVSGYRPIALSSCVLKLLERLVLRRLDWVLASRNLFSPWQFGFVKGSSTTEPLMILQHFILDSINNNKFVVVSFLDVQRAFDGVWHEAILAKLRSLGIVGNLYNWVKCFLSGREFSLSIGSHSTSRLADTGTPQGAVLSPRLFSLVFNGLAEVLPASVLALLFADDSTLGTADVSLDVALVKMQEALDQAATYGDKWGLPCSAEKTNYMIFSRHSDFTVNITLSLGNRPIKRVSVKKVLGVIFDDRLSFAAHINHVVKLAGRGINLMRSLARSNWGAHRGSLFCIFRGIIRSRLEYCSVIFSMAAERLLRKLDVVQHQALRVVTGLPYGTANHALHVETNSLPLQLRRDFACFKAMLKAKSLSSVVWQLTRAPVPPIAHFLTEYFSSRVLNLLAKFNKPNLLEMAEPVHLFNFTPPWSSLAGVSFDVGWLPGAKDSYAEAALLALSLIQIVSHPADVVFFTDGSKVSTGECALGLFSPSFPARNPSVKVSSLLSICNVELYAIKLAFLNLNNVPRSSSVLIVSDSLSALQMLKNPDPRSDLVCYILRRASEFSSTTFLWVPSHVGIIGNEMADRSAAAGILHGHAYTVPIPSCDLINSFFSSLQEVWNSEWRAAETGRILFSVKPVVGPWKHSPLPTRTEDCVITAMRCGRARLPSLRARFGYEDSDQCDHCGEEGTLDHFFFQCSLYDEPRLEFVSVLRDMGIPFTLAEVLGGGDHPIPLNNAILKRTLDFVKNSVGFRRILISHL